MLAATALAMASRVSLKAGSNGSGRHGKNERIRQSAAGEELANTRKVGWPLEDEICHGCVRGVRFDCAIRLLRAPTVSFTLGRLCPSTCLRSCERPINPSLPGTQFWLLSRFWFSNPSARRSLGACFNVGIRVHTVFPVMECLEPLATNKKIAQAAHSPPLKNCET